MKTLTKAAVLGAALVFAGHSAARAQGVHFGVAGTGLFSLQSGGGSAFGATGLLGFGRHTQKVQFRVDATVVHGSGATAEFGTGDVVYAFHTPESMLHPYLLAGAGIYHTDGFTKPMAKAGAGVDYHIQHRNRGTVLFGEATFNMIFAGNGEGTFKDLQLNVGLKFGD